MPPGQKLKIKHGNNACRTGFVSIACLLLMSAISVNAAEQHEDSWVVNYQDEVSVIASVNGILSYGDRLRLRLHKSDCSNAQLFTTFLTLAQGDDQLEDGFLISGVFLGQPAQFELLFTTPFFDRASLTWVDLGRGDVDAFNRALMGHKEITISVADGEGYTSIEYFTDPQNQWTTDGLSEAIAQAKEICSEL